LRDEFFLSVVGDSVAFSYVFLVSLAFFGSFLGNAKKNESINSIVTLVFST
jgi:hypothetical protein